MIQLFNEDCLETMKRIPDGSIDLMLTDPPYGVTQNKWDVAPNFAEMWLEWERILKPNGAWIFTAQQPFCTDLIISRRGFFKYDMIWYKPLGTGFLNANKMPMRNHEHILVFYRQLPTYNPQMGVGVRKKGMRKHDRNGTNYGKFATQGTSNYFDDKGQRFPQSVVEFTNGDRTKEADHPTQKPVDLFRYLIQTYTNENDTVFDGYLGSGTTAVACIKEKRNFIGSEISEEYFKHAELRIRIEQMQPALF